MSFGRFSTTLVEPSPKASPPVLERPARRAQEGLKEAYPENGLGLSSTSSTSSGPTVRLHTSQNGGLPSTLVSCDLQTV